jgi:hypothetical protein
MVTVTVFVEGEDEIPDPLALDPNVGLREAFHKLFAQRFDSRSIDIQVQPIGSITLAADIAASQRFGNHDALLIDLDGPENLRSRRLADSYSHPNIDTSRIFFMVQMMESWIISQPQAIEQFGVEENLLRKREDEAIASNQLLKGKTAPEIDLPDQKLETLLRQYFDEKRNWQGKTKLKGKKYLKKKDGPILIALLKFEQLQSDFVDVSALTTHFLAKTSSKT